MQNIVKIVTIQLKFEYDPDSEEFQTTLRIHRKEYPDDTISEMLDKLIYWIYRGTINVTKEMGPFGKIGINTTGNKNSLNMKYPFNKYNGISVIDLKQNSK